MPDVLQTATKSSILSLSCPPSTLALDGGVHRAGTSSLCCTCACHCVHRAPRESIPSVVSSNRSFRPRNSVKVTLLRSLANSVSLQDNCLVDLDACILCRSNSVNTGKIGCSHLTVEIKRAIAFWLSLLPRGPFRAVPPHSGTPFVIAMSDGEGSGSLAAAIWSPLAPGGVHQPRWFQLGLTPSVLHAWSESTETEPQRHINKIEAIVPAISLHLVPPHSRLPLATLHRQRRCFGLPCLRLLDNTAP